MTCATSQREEAAVLEAPVIKKDLLAYLTERFPDKAPTAEQSEREIWMAVGAVGVVRHLHHVFEDQQETILSKKVTK